jgi:hypothetical protein
VTQHFKGEIGGFFSIAEGLAVKQLKKQVTDDGQTLKKPLEAGWGRQPDRQGKSSMGTPSRSGYHGWIELRVRESSGD